MSDHDDIVREFLVESRENLDRLDRSLVSLEKDPTLADLVGDVFRTIHTLKGTSAFLRLPKLEALAHAGESLLTRARDGGARLDGRAIDALLALVDAVRRILSHVESTGAEGDFDIAALVARLAEAAASMGSETPATPATPAENADPAAPVASGDSVRIDVALLNALMNSVGELVLARNQILACATSLHEPQIAAASQRLSVVTSELQKGVMKTRMQPIGNLFGRLPRIVRDLASACRKEVRVELSGQDTELDRTLLEAIKDPLIHLIRNAVDHGIESREDRIAAGKAPIGCIAVRAFHERGMVNIELSDDGAGIDVERIVMKALDRGLLTAEEAHKLGDHERMRLLFAPGLSTAGSVTSVSGRGVGMDVVKTNIERIGGVISISSERGRGACFTIKVPLTLAIVRALLLSCGGERYAIAEGSLRELVLVDPTSGRGIEFVHGAPVLRLRGRLVPVIDLAAALGLSRAKGEPDGSYVVIVDVEDRAFGLLVDDVEETMEIVVKPLDKRLRGISAFAGATILGDGRVALILDTASIARRAKVGGGESSRHPAEDSKTPEPSEADRRELLFIRASDGSRMALPLSLVERVAEFPRARVERMGELEVVQYGGEILLLGALSRLLQERRREARSTVSPSPARDTIEVVMVRSGAARVGLVVDEIVDIAEVELSSIRPASRRGVVCSAVIREHVTELLDVPALILGLAGAGTPGADVLRGGAP